MKKCVSFAAGSLRIAVMCCGEVCGVAFSVVGFGELFLIASIETWIIVRWLHLLSVAGSPPVGKWWSCRKERSGR